MFMNVNRYITLADLDSGQGGKVVAFECGHKMAHRLESMGIRVGAVITKLTGYSLRGPISVKIGNTCLALGHGIANKIIVEPIK